MTNPTERFTIRELEVMKRVGNGMTYTEIAEDLGISPRTVEAHAATAAAKLPDLDHLTPKPAILEFWRRIAA